MKYISLIDELNITIETLQTIDDNRIDQLQSQLDFESTLDSTTNYTQISQLLNQLKNKELRETFIFIERHTWIKKILLYQPELIDDKALETTYDPREITPHTKTYISSYLTESITTTLSYLFNKEKFNLFARVASQKRFFSEEVIQEIVMFLSKQLIDAKKHIAKEYPKKSFQSLSYLINPEFIKLASIYIKDINEEVISINNDITRIYNLNKESKNLEWEFATSVIIAFEKFPLLDQQLQEQSTKNALTAKSDKNMSDLKNVKVPNPDTVNFKTNNSRSIYMIITIVIVVFFVFISILFFFINNTINNLFNNKTIYREPIETPIEPIEYLNKEEVTFNQTQNDNSNIDVESDTESIEKTTLTETERVIIPGHITLPNQPKSYTQDNHIRFLYSLKNKVVKGDDNKAKRIIRVTPFTNPYPKTFNPITVNNSSSISQIEINNNTKKELIIFKLQNGIDEAITIPKDDKAMLDFKQGDSIIFYAGNDFTESRFSHFTRKQDISNIYQVTSLSISSKIDVLPFKDNSGSIKNTRFHRSIESLKFHNLEVKKTKTIESLYTDYYKAYYEK